MVLTSKAFSRRSILRGFLAAATALLLTTCLCMAIPEFVAAQESTQEMTQPAVIANGGEGQDRETMALDSTATQWSFQLAYQVMPDYHNDILDNGQMRPQGNTDYLQLRIVAPIPFESFTILPRLTIRHYENAQGQSGLGNTELFGLIIPRSWDWGSGRVGIGPLITLPGDKDVASDEWGYGLAAAAVNAKDKWFYGLLLTQTWRAVDPLIIQPGASDMKPLGIAPFLNYRMGNGWYIGNGDMVARWDWNMDEFYLPIGVRVGKVLVGKESSWNIYAEYQTSLIYKNWSGSAIKNSFRFNVTYTLPVM
jgi:hypothetical protein